MKAGKLGILSVGLIFGLSACDILGGGPTITSFTATPSSITAGGTSVLAWSVDSTATTISISGGVGTVTTDPDDRFEVSPTANTTYTLTATNAEGGTSTRTAAVTIVGGGTDTGGTPPPPPGGGDPTGAPTGTFGVSTSATGTFQNDVDGGITSDTDPRIISVADGSTFYAQVSYTDPDGIASAVISIVNSTPEGLSGPVTETPSGGFALAGEPTGTCEVGSASNTTVTCVYPISVAAGTPDISSLTPTEFAYVFRVNVTDTLGNSALQTESGLSRGYVNVQ